MAGTTKTVKNRTGGISKKAKTNLSGYLFISPWLIGLLLLTIWPITQSFRLAFTDYSLFGGDPAWVGLGNFKEIFNDTVFRKSISTTFSFVAMVVPLKLVFSLIVAMLLNQDVRAMGLYRTCFYLPSLVGTSVAVSLLWRILFGNDGYVNALMTRFGLEKQAWLNDPSIALKTLVLLNVWQFGSTMIIFLTGLKQIPSEMYESASIDGANAFVKFFKITLPMLSSVLFFNLILGIINAFQQFNAAFIITKGGPAYSTNLYSLMLYKKAFVDFRMGYASGLAWILLVIIAILTMINFVVSKYWVYYSD